MLQGLTESIQGRIGPAELEREKFRQTLCVWFLKQFERISGIFGIWFLKYVVWNNFRDPFCFNFEEPFCFEFEVV